MEFLPVFFDIKGKQCLLVGGGDIALRKAVLLDRAGARIKLVSPKINDSLKQLITSQDHSFRLGEFEESDLTGSCLVIAATNNTELNQRVASMASKLNIPVNVVDQPELCSIIFPAVIDRGPVLVAVSSSGTSPILTRKIKEQIEVLLPNRLDALARKLGELRPLVKLQIPDFSKRIQFWESLMDSPVPELVYAGNLKDADAQIANLLNASQVKPLRGEVYLVGAGPGDPDLLTLRALRLLLKADVVLYDRLVSPEIMQKIRPDAEKIHVGKERAHHTVPQEQINQMLVRLARDGKRVLRLKGGDPFIFGRGGEEIELLMEEGIPFQVVPGITAASGCASYAGIPLTHRDLSQSVIFLTGHDVDGEHAPDWSMLARENQTLVFYMGLMTLRRICEQLQAHGMDREMPAALIQQGTTDRQKLFRGTIQTLPDIIAKEEVKAPTLLIVGRVVSLHDRLSWFTPSG